MAKVGRPRGPVGSISKWALWKRAQRSDNRPKNKGMIRHHTDKNYGRNSSKTVYMSRALHNRLHHKK
jgi:hypothetical protein